MPLTVRVYSYALLECLNRTSCCLKFILVHNTVKHYLHKVHPLGSAVMWWILCHTACYRTQAYKLSQNNFTGNRCVIQALNNLKLFTFCFLDFVYLTFWIFIPLHFRCVRLFRCNCYFNHNLVVIYLFTTFNVIITFPTDADMRQTLTYAF